MFGRLPHGGVIVVRDEILNRCVSLYSSGSAVGRQLWRKDGSVALLSRRGRGGLVSRVNKRREPGYVCRR